MPSVPRAHYTNLNRPVETTMIQGTNINIGRFNARVEMTNQVEKRNALELLRSNSSLGALIDAKQRYDPPRCAETTRRNILGKMEDWARRDNLHGAPSSIFWLYGGAGAGKSALAQTLAEKFKTNEDLAASFFFFKADVNRNNGDCLIPTLALQLIQSFEGLAPFVEEKVYQNPDLFQQSRQTQMLELLIEPLIRLSLDETDGVVLKSHPRLIVIDGLDECRDSETQCDLLRIIASSIPHFPYPIRFLITSRPESHITHTFRHDVGKVPRYNLSDDSDADKDIQRFLEGKFAKIRATHPLKQHLPSRWPPRSSISLLVERSSGHFIYAATVIRFIQSRRHRPDDRLRVILGLKQPCERDQPFARLDLLYRLIFLEIEDSIQLEKIHRALGIMHLRSLKLGIFEKYWWTSDIKAIEYILELRPGDLVLIFDPLLSLVTFQNDDIRIFHKSLFDYLLDPSRGRDLRLDLGFAHESAADYIVRSKNIQGRAGDLEHFLYHCHLARLNDGLTSHLRSLACDPNLTVTNALPAPCAAACHIKLIVFFLGIIGRQEFDCSVQCYEKYVEKETRCLRSVVPRSQRLMALIPTLAGLERVILKSPEVKSRVRSLFRISNWLNLKASELRDPKGFYGKVPVAAVNKRNVVKTTIKKEHEMFSSLVKAHHRYPNTVTVSTLEHITGLIHSCHFVFDAQQPVWVKAMILVTYADHGVRLSFSGFWGLNRDFNRNSHENIRRLVAKHFQMTEKAVESAHTVAHYFEWPL